jgi:hypothetical protein
LHGKQLIFGNLEHLHGTLDVQFFKPGVLGGSGLTAADLFKEEFAFVRFRRPAIGAGDEAHGFAVRPAVERKSVLAIVVVNQIAFAKRTSSQRLDGIDRSHVGLDDGHNLLVGGVRPDFAQRDLSGANSDRESRAKMTVELLGLVDHGIHKCASYPVESYGMLVRCSEPSKSTA